MRLTTQRKYDFFACMSAMQKAIRRNDPYTAAYFALELYDSGYHNACWKRLAIITAEDCDGLITSELWALYEAFNKFRKNDSNKHCQIFITKAVLLLCSHPKNRDADHLIKYVREDIDIEKMNWYLREYQMEIPDYAYDCHTLKGKRKGLTKSDFFKKEYEELQLRVPGIMDEYIEGTF